MTRRAEGEVELLARLSREVTDLRSTVLARVAGRRLSRVPVFAGFGANAQSITSGSHQPIVIDGELVDTFFTHSTTVNPSQWVCPTGWSGVYLAGGKVAIDTTVSDQVVSAALAVNGSVVGYTQLNAFGSNDFSASTGLVELNLVEGDIVQLMGAQYTGSTKSTISGLTSLTVSYYGLS